MHLSDTINLIVSAPTTGLALLLLSGVITVNGWTDAPTAIATCISSRTISPKKAIVLAAIMNFLGVAVMSAISGKVVDSVTSIANFGTNTSNATTALCASMVSIVLWAVTAWFFGIPTSESHALVGALAGSAIALTGKTTCISASELTKVIYGLFISTVSGFMLGFISAKIISTIIKNKNRQTTDIKFKYLQNFSAAFMAFMHGAQDGQKFIGVFILLMNNLTDNKTNTDEIPAFLIIYVSLLMATGTSVGGTRIIKSMGIDMVKLKKYQGFAADLSSAISLLISTLTGLPVSTTHTKTTSIMGVGAAKKLSSVDWKIVKDMMLTWILTFPGCGFLGYLITKIFLVVR